MSAEKHIDGFGNRFREERIRLGYTQSTLARSLNYRQQTVYKYEKNVTFPDVSLLYSLQQIGFDIEFLIFGVTRLRQIRNVPTHILNQITTVVKELEMKLGVGTMSEEQRLQISLFYVEYYLQNPDSDLTSVAVLNLLLNSSS